ncbi:PREDICTED: sex-regulated protein janus-A-like [Rhagoletis zephyria]|uniref:sex-regulated protein janus-A-like n=1 Tax=Rhagoletis zephyria TaxID=28612 RepID=UPI0008115CCC|nr:PREDICTED: sex-regulated protein janus-A-like [Rhagoletis zephyria]XP_036337950.1 sex-regulated protein janus-A-like isoform X2 [Rhagoletis pomonella]
MVDTKLEAVPSVDIGVGIFKYVLIKVYGKDESYQKIIVRGYADCQWHSDIYDRSSESLKGLGLETECLGGGRIEYNSNSKLIKVYGYSQGFGKADHYKTKQILQDKFPEYEIQISDEGY